jgi:2-isopropylmalate synthase
MENRIRIFDTTLRDGEQAPGCTMTVQEKLAVARQLARLQVDVIEAGFPAASSGEFDAVANIAAEVGSDEGPIICGLARTHPADIEICARANERAARPRIHTFLATSDIHLEHKLGLSRQQALKRIDAMVRHARTACADVEFSPEDACRTDREFLCEVVAVAIEAGAATINIPDTVGYITPNEYFDLIRMLLETVPRARDVVLSTHCHDDLGLAVANTLAGVRAGARQVECTVNGLGERAGNASLEEVVMALETRRPLLGFGTGVRTTEIARTSRLVAASTGVPVPPNKAIVGGNAFAHEAGIHQDGVLKNPSTYEIMSAASVGMDGGVVIGKHSGRRAFRRHVTNVLGRTLDEAQLHAAFLRFKDLADKKKMIDDRDIEVILDRESARPVVSYEVEHVQVSCGTHAIPTATVRLRGPGEVRRVESAQGTGPVHAVCEAVNRIIGDVGELVEFAVTAVTEGISAVGDVMIRVQEHIPTELMEDGVVRTVRRTYTGYGVHTDIVVAAAEAYVSALNKLLASSLVREEKIPSDPRETSIVGDLR